MTPPNEEMIEYWNERPGERWVEASALLDDQLAPFGLAVMERVAPRAGERVLDVGCGCGQTTFQLAERVGATGAVVGLDISAPMLALARRRAEEAGTKGVRFIEGDAQVASFSERFDLAFSRFGVMFFEDPAAAFTNLREALVPGGRLAFACWQPLARNPWMRLPLMAVASQIELSGPPAPDAPGPFSFGDAERVTGILTAAGFADVALEGVDLSLRVGGGGSLDDAVEFLLGLGPAGAALRDAGDDVKERVRGAVREAIRPFETDGGVVMDSAFWIATGRIATGRNPS